MARREQKAQAAATRQSSVADRRNLQRETAKIEKRMADLQNELSLIEARCADPALYCGPDQTLLRSLQARQGELAPQLDLAEERWLALQAELENLPPA